MTQPLNKFIGKLESITTAAFRTNVARQVATGGLRLIATGYRTSVDPYGSRWEPLKRRAGRPLVKTGAFRDTWMAYPTPTGVRFVSGVSYGAYHQYGTRSIPFRRVVPMQRYGLPKAWTDVINAAFSDSVRKAIT